MKLNKLKIIEIYIIFNKKKVIFIDIIIISILINNFIFYILLIIIFFFLNIKNINKLKIYFDNLRNLFI